MLTRPTVFSPAHPLELLSYVVSHCLYPTTVIICSPRPDFITRLASGADEQQPAEGDPVGNVQTEERQQHHASASLASRLLHAPVYQVAVARHIRIVFVPTVIHLRAFLATFSPLDSNIQSPPSTVAHGSDGRTKQQPLLLVYDLLQLHKDTSEWSVQGLSNTFAGLVEAASREAFRAVVVEGKQPGTNGYLREAIPVLSGSARRRGIDSDEGGWSGRTTEVQRVLGKWFTFEPGSWELETDLSG